MPGKINWNCLRTVSAQRLAGGIVIAALFFADWRIGLGATGIVFILWMRHRGKLTLAPLWATKGRMALIVLGAACFYIAPYLTLLIAAVVGSALALKKLARRLQSSRSVFARALLAVCYVAWFIFSCAAAVLYYGYSLLGQENKLQDFAMAEIKKRLKPELAPYMKPPRHIQVLLRDRKILLEDWVLPDAAGKILATVKRVEIVLGEIFPKPTLQSVTVEGVHVFLQRREDGHVNWDILAEREEGGPEKLPEIRMREGEISLDFPGMTRTPLAVKDVRLEIIATGDSHVISGSFAAEFIERVEISGNYSDKDGLDLALTPVAFSLVDVAQRFIVPAGFKVEGKVRLDGLVLHIGPAGLAWQAKAALAEGNLYWHGLNFTGIEADLGIDNGRISKIRAGAWIESADIKISGGYIEPQGRMQMDVQLANLSLSDSLPRLLGEPVQKYWRMFKPQGVIAASGVVERTKDGDWDWDARAHLRQGSVGYRNLRCEDIELSLQLRPQEIAVIEGKWHLREGAFRLQPGGRVSWQPLEIQGLALDFDNFRLTPDIWKEFPEADDVWKLLQPQGVVDGRASWNGGMDLGNLAAEVKCRDFQAIFDEVPHPADQAFATLKLERGILELDVHGKMVDNSGRVELTGNVWPFAKPYGAAYDVRVKVSDVVLTGQVYRTFDSDWRTDIRDVWDTLEFAQNCGCLDVEIHAHRRPDSEEYLADGPTYFYVVVIGRDLKAKCRYFPYPITHVNGKVVAQSRQPIVFSDITARKDEGELSVSGELLPTPQGMWIKELIVRGKNIALDDELKNALGEEGGIWDEISPKGRIGIEVKLSKKPDRNVRWQADVSLEDVSARYREFPYRMDHVSGRLHVKPDQFRLRDVKGKSGHGQATINGWVAPPRFDLRIEAEDIPVDNKLRKALRKLSPEVNEICEKFFLVGPVSGKVKVRRKDPAMPADWKVVLDVKEASGYYCEFPYSLDRISGRISIAPQSFVIDCKGESEEGQFAVSGGKEGKDHVSFKVRGTNVALSDKLCRALSEEQRQIWRQFHPEGRADFELTVTLPEGRTDYVVHILPRDCSILYEKFPYRIDGVSLPPEETPQSGITISGSSFAGTKKSGASVIFDDICGKNGNSRFRLSGTFHSLAAAEQVRLELKVLGRDVVVNSDLRRALAEFFPNMMKKLAPEGNIASVQFDLEYYDAPEKYTKYRFESNGMDATMTKGEFLEQVAGNLVMEGYGYGNRHHGDGYLKNGEIVLHGLHFTHVESPIRLFKDYLQFSPIEGSFYQGNARAWIILDVTDYGGFKGSCTVNTAQLNSVIKALAERSAKKKKAPLEKNPGEGAKGILSGEISFQGNFHDSDLLTGRGWLQVHSGEIWRLPLLLAIFDILSLPERPAFREGESRFSISRGRFDINMLKLHSSLLSISGNGTLDFDGNLRLQLLTHFAPHYLPRIPLISQILDMFKREFFELYVTGTLSQPSITLPQWETLRDLLK